MVGLQDDQHEGGVIWDIDLVLVVELVATVELDFEVKVGEELKPADLATDEELGGHEILQVSVVREDLYAGASGLKVREPFFKAADDSEQLLVIDLVVTLGRGVFL